MRRLYTTFPSGFPGVGLLLLRVAVGLILLVQACLSILGTPEANGGLYIPALLASMIGILFILGLLTPLAGLLTVLAGIALQLWHPSWNAYLHGLPGVNLAVMVTSITLVGPGAFSLDARLFGRRKVIVPRVTLP